MALRIQGRYIKKIGGLLWRTLVFLLFLLLFGHVRTLITGRLQVTQKGGVGPSPQFCIFIFISPHSPFFFFISVIILFLPLLFILPFTSYYILPYRIFTNSFPYIQIPFWSCPDGNYLFLYIFLK